MGDRGMTLSLSSTKKVDKLLRAFDGPEPTRQAYVAWLLDREIAKLPKPEDQGT